MSRRFVVFVGDVYSDERDAGSSTVGSGFTYCDWMEPLRMTQVSNGEIGECEIRCWKNYEDAYDADETQAGVAVQILDLGDDGPTDPPANGQNSEDPPSYTADDVVFDGVIYKRMWSVKGDSTEFKLICYNTADDFFRRSNLHGQARRNIAFEQSTFTAGPKGPQQSARFDTDIVLTDIPLIFNPNGLKNASQDTYYDTTMSNSSSTLDIHIFEPAGRNQYNKNGNQILAQPWTLSMAVKYLLVWETTEWCIQQSSIDTAIKVITDNGDPVISEFNAEGKNLLQALGELLPPYNYFFSINMSGPASSNQGNAEPIAHPIYIYFRGYGPETTVQLADRGTNSSALDSNLIDEQIVEDYTPVVNNLAAVAQPEVFTTVVHTNPPTGLNPPLPTLVPSWNNGTSGSLVWNLDTNGNVITGGAFATQYSNEDYGYARTVDQTGAALTAPYQYGIGRKWLVNLGEVPWSPLEQLTYDLTDPVTLVSLPQNNSVDPRRLEKPELFTTNSEGGQLSQLDVIVEMSTDSGANWGIVEPHWYRVLTDECGIEFIEPNLDPLGLTIKNGTIDSGKSYWQALHDSTLQIRIICSLKSDRRLTIVDHNQGDTFPLAVERQFQNDGYRLKSYHTYLNNTLIYTGTTPLKDPYPDDSSALQTLVDQQELVSDNAMTVGTFVILLDQVADYYPGQVVTSDNRIDFDFPPTILKVEYNFPAQHVTLTMDSKIVATLRHGVPLYAQSRQQRRLGIGGTQAVQGGQQVPYIPGDRASMREYYEGGGQ